MATLVLTVIGVDRSGLVSALSGVIADHGGSWERSEMARLAGRFAGIVVVEVPEERAEALVAELGPLRTEGLLDVTVERGVDPGPESQATRISLDLVGADRPGIVHEITRVLAARQVGIDDLRTATREAPMFGGMLFEASATLLAPPSAPIAELQAVLEELANELMVDLSLSAE